MLWVEGLHVQWSWSWLEPIFICLSRIKWGMGVGEGKCNMIFSLLYKETSIAKSGALWDFHYPNDVEFYSCVSIVHLFMHCIYLTSWYRDLILVCYILQVSLTFLKIKPAGSAGPSNGWTTYSFLHRTVQLLKKWRLQNNFQSTPYNENDGH